MSSTQRQWFGFLMGVTAALVLAGILIHVLALDYGDLWTRASLMAGTAGIAAFIATAGALTTGSSDDDLGLAGVLSLVLALLVGLVCAVATGAAALAATFDLGEPMYAPGGNRGGSLAMDLGWLTASAAALGAAIVGFARLRPDAPTEPFIGQFTDP